MSNSRQKNKRGAKESGARTDDSILEWVQDMPMARAILTHDTDALGRVLKQSLPSNVQAVDQVAITKSVGEAFTGGRSTPVYEISCQVTRNNMPPKQRHFIVKLVLLLPDAEPDQNTGSPNDVQDPLWVKRESYAVERRFYQSVAPRLKDSRCNLTVPKLLVSDRDGSRPWPVACFCMNDLRHAGFPHHPPVLSFSQAKCALQWMATFHAHFWGQVHPSTCTWRRDLWSRGGFWTNKQQEQQGEAPMKTSHVTTAGMAQQWSRTVRFLEGKYPQAVTECTHGLGKRLEAVAGPIAEYLTQQSSLASLGTLIHGDFKAANLFLADNADTDNGGVESVAVLDFQFSGLGLGAEDVAYLLFPDARGHYFEHEQELLKCYHEELIEQLIIQQKGGPSTISFQAFCGYYELSRIDFVRYLLGKGWVASTDGDVQLVAALENTLNSLDGGHILPSKEEYIQRLVNITVA